MRAMFSRNPLVWKSPLMVRLQGSQTNPLLTSRPWSSWIWAPGLRCTVTEELRRTPPTTAVAVRVYLSGIFSSWVALM